MSSSPPESGLAPPTAGKHSLHTGGGTGSIPVAPTIKPQECLALILLVPWPDSKVHIFAAKWPVFQRSRHCAYQQEYQQFAAVRSGSSPILLSRGTGGHFLHTHQNPWKTRRAIPVLNWRKRQAHNLKVLGSNPGPATKKLSQVFVTPPENPMLMWCA